MASSLLLEREVDRLLRALQGALTANPPPPGMDVGLVACSLCGAGGEALPHAVCRECSAPGATSTPGSLCYLTVINGSGAALLGSVADGRNPVKLHPPRMPNPGRPVGDSRNEETPAHTHRGARACRRLAADCLEGDQWQERGVGGDTGPRHRRRARTLVHAKPDRAGPDHWPDQYRRTHHRPQHVAPIRGAGQ